MTLKLIPPFVDAKPAVLDVFDRSGAIFVEVDKLYKLWPYVTKGGIVIASIHVSELAILQRFMSSMLEEAPTIITGVPGCFYSAEWNMLGAHLPSAPYSELEAQLLKSGFLSHTPEQAETRGHQVLGAPPLGQQGMLARASGKSSAPVRDDDEDEDDLVTGASV